MREQAFDPGAECVEGRDALPDLLHGRLTGEARARADAHVAMCVACAAEFALLRAARRAIVAGAPPVDAAAIAGAVRKATVQGAHGSGLTARPVTVRIAPHVARTTWRGSRQLRALAATVLVVIGAGALVYGRASRDLGTPATSDAPGVAMTSAGTAGPTGARESSIDTAREGAAVLAVAGPALGARFDDLTDEELRAVLAAIDGTDASLVSFEPEPATPAVNGGG